VPFFRDATALTGKSPSRTVPSAPSRGPFPGRRTGRPPAPLAPIREFNPFSTGLQSACVEANVKTHVGSFSGQTTMCLSAARTRQAFERHQMSRSVPVYGLAVDRRDRRVGDGIDQDDMVSFLARIMGALGRQLRQCRLRDPLRRSRSRSATAVPASLGGLPFARSRLDRARMSARANSGE
jgi:hypothetical protein